MALSTEDFRKGIGDRLREASATGAGHLDINAGKLHRELGGYPSRGHRMPTCCGAMRAMMRAGDSVLFEPPKGNGASLTVRYLLPRG
jgi:hypothetical protein